MTSSGTFSGTMFGSFLSPKTYWKVPQSHLSRNLSKPTIPPLISICRQLRTSPECAYRPEYRPFPDTMWFPFSSIAERPDLPAVAGTPPVVCSRYCEGFLSRQDGPQNLVISVIVFVNPIYKSLEKMAALDTKEKNEGVPVFFLNPNY